VPILPLETGQKALNFTSVTVSPNETVPSDPFLKPVGIPPPVTLREARLSPWWPQYRAAMDVEYQGHRKNGTWEFRLEKIFYEGI
jgi:hypothetical protein